MPIQTARLLPIAPTKPTHNPHHVAVDHARIRSVDTAIFSLSFTADCYSHRCRCVDRGNRVRLDACCQYGADVLIPEKQAILRRVSEVASVLDPDRRSPETWFDEREPGEDPEVPFGIIIRTATADPDKETSGCVFLQHDGARGCGLHRAALEHGFDPAEIKPAVCRLYPLSFDAGQLGLSDDFEDYSCAHEGDVSVYRVMRPTLEQMFGEAAVTALDRLQDRASAASHPRPTILTSP